MKQIDKNMLKQKKVLAKQKKKQEKLAKKDAYWLENYGISYANAILGGKNQAKKKKHHLLYYTIFAFKQIKTNKKIFVLLVVLQIIGAIAYFFVPVFTEKVISALELGNYNSILIYGIGATFCAFTATILGYYVFENLNIKTVRSMGHGLGLTIVQKLLRTKQQKFAEMGSGEIVNKSQHASTWFVERLGIAIGDIAFIVRDFAVCAYLAYLDFRLLAVLLTGGLLYSIITIYCNMKYIKNYDRLHEKVSDKLYNTFGEIVHGCADVKILNNANVFTDKIAKNQAYQKNVDIKSSNTWLALSGVLANIFYFGFQILFYVVCAMLLLNNAVAISVVIVCIMNKNDIMLLFENTGNVIVKINKCEVMAERIYNILDEEQYPTEKFGSKHITNFKGNIEFHNVCFSYPGENKHTLDNTSFTINAGEKVAFVGASGGGKSTIINLLPKLLEKNSGQILLDGIDIDELDKNSIRDNISLVPQTPYIFNGSIEENLLFANVNATEHDMINTLKQAQLYDFVLSKPNGIKTIIGEGGICLSGGQRQRLAIARALLRNSKVLLLDEATSALDNQTQKEIKQTIDNLSGKTVIIVAHRLSTVIDCDKIMVLQHGQIIASGSHNELMKNNKEYQSLYKTKENDTKEGE